MADYHIEQELCEKGGRSFIAGIDEVGRGCLFGPVLAAAVVLPYEWHCGLRPDWMSAVDDSKTLSANKRKDLAARIFDEAVAVGVGTASVREIEECNIRRASLLAMTRAVQGLPLTPHFLLIDGPRLELQDIALPQRSISGGDRTSKSIAAASIVAKVLRDELMIVYDYIYKGYYLCKNKGYGTREHYRALREKGPTSLHRRTFKLWSEAEES